MSDKLLLNAIYVGINIVDILYGVELVLYFRTMYALLNHPGGRTKSDVFYALFSSVMLLMVTIWMFVQVIFGQKIWVLDTGFPGGPSGSWVANMWSWYMDLGMMALVVLQLMTDGLMAFRCWVIWNNSRAIIIPLILWTVTFVLGVLTIWAVTVSGGLYLHPKVAQFSLAYYTVSVSLNVMLTSMICYRLARYGKLMKEHLGREYAWTYFAAFALIIESVLPNSLAGIALLISLGIGSQTEVVFGDVYALMMCISPQMLILRVAMRLSTSDAVKQPPSMVQFSPIEDMVLGSVSKDPEVSLTQTLDSSRKGNDNMV